MSPRTLWSWSPPLSAHLLAGLPVVLAAACGHAAAAPHTVTRPQDSHPGGSRCISPRALGERAGAATRRVDVAAGRLVTLQLIEPEAYASSRAGRPPAAFPWRPARSSNPAALRPVAVCP